jgi:hypothetical protein
MLIYPISHFPCYCQMIWALKWDKCSAINNLFQITGIKQPHAFSFKIWVKKCWLFVHSFNKVLTYLLTYSWSWALLEKLPIVQPLKNFPAFYGTRMFITAFTRALHWSLFWASTHIQNNVFIKPHYMWTILNREQCPMH